MTIRALIAGSALPFLAACGNTLSVAVDLPVPQATPVIQLESLGGIASLRVQLRLDSTTATLSRETCGMTVTAAECGIRGRRDVIGVPAADVARLFAMTTTADFRALKADYGHSTQGADLMDHTLTITTGGRTRSVRGDDITRPDLMAGVMAALNGFR